MTATRTSRIVSYLIDSLILVVLLVPIIYFYYSLNSIDILNINDENYYFIWQYPIELFWLELISTLIVSFYFFLSPIFLNGQTIGRKVMNIAIVNNDGSPVSVKNMFVREILLLTIINALTGGILFFVGSLFILGENKIALYDTWSKTKLVEV